jgi:branched-chain amino acid transport system permease protein
LHLLLETTGLGLHPGTLWGAIGIGLAVGSLYALVALGLGLIYRVVGVINFAQGEFAAFGVLVVTLLSSGAVLDIHVPVWPAVAVALVLSGGLGVALYLLAVKPLLGGTAGGWILSTVAFGVVLRSLFGLYFDHHTPAFPSLFGTGQFVAGELVVPFALVLATLAAVALSLVLIIVVEETPFARAIRAVGRDRSTAKLMGIDTGRAIGWVFAIAGVASAAGGILVVGAGSIAGAPGADIGLALGIKGFVAALLGGMRAPRNALIGGLVLGLFEQVVSFQAGLSTAGADILTMFLLVVLLWLRPNGILDRRRMRFA